MHTPPGASGQRDRRILIGLGLYAIVLHSVLLVYDCVEKYAAFYRVDRSENRVDAMHRLFEAHTIGGLGNAIVTNNIIVGEYILQSGLFRIGGPLAVILVQIVLQLCSIFAVYRIARLVLDSPTLSGVSALLYASLPYSIVFPHQFASESIAVPFVIITYWLIVEYLIRDASWVWLLLAGFLCGCAALMRPVLLLLPALLSLCVIAKRGRSVSQDVISIVGAGALPPLLLVALFWSTTHQMSLGNANSGMSYNLYLRMMRITPTLPPNDQQYVIDRFFSGKMNSSCIGNAMPSDGSSCTMPISAYVSFVRHYPLTSVSYVFRDLISFVAKSGVSSITTNYLDISPENDARIKDYRNGWHTVWETKGLKAAIVMVIKLNPLAAILELLGSGLFLLLFGCFLIGCYEVGRLAVSHALSRPRVIALCSLALLPHYLFATSEVGSYTLSRYRYPGEFAMCILAVLGGDALMSRIGARRQLPPSLPLTDSSKR